MPRPGGNRCYRDRASKPARRLVDEVSLLIHPSLVGGTSQRGLFRAPDLASAEGVIALKLLAVQALEGDSVWLRYRVEQE